MLRQVILLPTALALLATALVASPPANAAAKPGARLCVAQRVSF